jgi:hypothetical protein
VVSLCAAAADPSIHLTMALPASPLAHRCARQRTSLVGYVAVCDSTVEVRCMGRHDVRVALCGTCTVLEWAENVRASLVPASTSGDDNPAKVE